uniref:RNA-directed DNA polymerase n=1 Tax=Ditylenchus dipsaci TaxID=166011 RepID=A0A915DR15_9BILA
MVMSFVSNGWPKSLKDPLDTKESSKTTKDPKGQNSLCVCVGCQHALASAPSIPKEVVLFSHQRSFLSIVSSVLMFKERVVIPASNQKSVLQLLHQGHPGICRMKQLARSYCYWPQMESQIEDMVKKCSPCALSANLPTKHQLHSWPQSTKPWQRIHLDFAGPINSKSFLIVVDSYSKYPEVFPMQSTSADAVISKLKSLFVRHGLPETLVSDNGTQFSSNVFRQFCKSNGVEQLFSPAYHPQSNGQAERFVATFKNALFKLKEGRNLLEAIELFLLSYRTTPCSSAPNGVSPAEAFLGRKLRAKLDLLLPSSHEQSVRNGQMEQQFNRRNGAKNRQFHSGDSVLCHLVVSRQWVKGTIINCRGVVYAVQMPSGRIRDFHVNHLRRSSFPDEDELPADILLECFNLPSVESQVAAALPQEQRWNGIEEQSPVRSPDQLSVAESPPLSPVAQSPVQMPVITSPLPPLRRSSRKRAPRTMLQLDGKKCYKKEQPYQ